VNANTFIADNEAAGDKIRTALCTLLAYHLSVIRPCRAHSHDAREMSRPTQQDEAETLHVRIRSDQIEKRVTDSGTRYSLCPS
jgi:hypothetical protein